MKKPVLHKFFAAMELIQSNVMIITELKNKSASIPSSNIRDLTLWLASAEMHWSKLINFMVTEKPGNHKPTLVQVVSIQLYNTSRSYFLISESCLSKDDLLNTAILCAPVWSGGERLVQSDGT